MLLRGQKASIDAWKGYSRGFVAMSSIHERLLSAKRLSIITQLSDQAEKQI
jgi:hypothetical protein